MIVIATQGSEDEDTSTASLETITNEEEANSMNSYIIGILFGLTSSWLYSFCSVFNRRL